MSGFTLLVKGKRACFTRPEFKVERVSYDVITPSAARAIFEAIYWKPAIRWVIDEIRVINPIKFENIKRNEVDDVITKGKKYVDINDNRQQRNSLILKDVSYVIKAHFELTELAENIENVNEKHYSIFLRRTTNGQCYNQPYLGCREFSCDFELITDDSLMPESLNITQDLGWMLYDKDYNNNSPIFYRPTMVNGVIKVPHYRDVRRLT